jgi:hypothetical protein
MTKIAIIHYSMYGHVATMSESIKKGVLAADPTIQCDIYQVPETLPDDVLQKMYAPPKGDYPIISKDQLSEYDGFLFGISGRYGMISAQMKVRSNQQTSISSFDHINFHINLRFFTSSLNYLGIYGYDWIIVDVGCVSW